MGLERVTRLDLPSFKQGPGALTVIEDLPFEIKRAFFISLVPPGESRGGHANRDAHVFVAIAGSFDLFLDDGTGSRTWTLRRPNEGVYVPPLIWRVLRNFTRDAICLVLSNRPYSADDYIRNYERFLAEVRDPQRGAEVKDQPAKTRNVT